MNDFDLQSSTHCLEVVQKKGMSLKKTMKLSHYSDIKLMDPAKPLGFYPCISSFNPFRECGRVIHLNSNSYDPNLIILLKKQAPYVNINLYR